MFDFSPPESTLACVRVSGAIDVSPQSGRVVVATADTQITAVPEPASLFLLGSGIVGVAAKVRKRRAQGAH